MQDAGPSVLRQLYQSLRLLEPVETNSGRRTVERQFGKAKVQENINPNTDNSEYYPVHSSPDLPFLLTSASYMRGHERPTSFSGTSCPEFQRSTTVRTAFPAVFFSDAQVGILPVPRVNAAWRSRLPPSWGLIASASLAMAYRPTLLDSVCFPQFSARTDERLRGEDALR